MRRSNSSINRSPNLQIKQTLKKFVNQLSFQYQYLLFVNKQFIHQQFQTPKMAQSTYTLYQFIQVQAKLAKSIQHPVRFSNDYCILSNIFNDPQINYLAKRKLQPYTYFLGLIQKIQQNWTIMLQCDQSDIDQFTRRMHDKKKALLQINSFALNCEVETPFQNGQLQRFLQSETQFLISKYQYFHINQDLKDVSKAMQKLQAMPKKNQIRLNSGVHLQKKTVFFSQKQVKVQVNVSNEAQQQKNQNINFTFRPQKQQQQQSKEQKLLKKKLEFKALKKSKLVSK